MTNEEELRYVEKSIQRIRRAKKVSQLELSARANLSQSFLANVETGKKDPSALTLIRIARALECSPRDFFPDIQTGTTGAMKESVKQKIAELLKVL
ncbi:MAG: helix-turn-helix transcriptional regulator [Treponema sp.]|nr:helix-turn-helix transcriptional regulator [Treponema sp.]MBQ9238775.1 helix-turn-helix transcriptional regulator [Treponema sp.]